MMEMGICGLKNLNHQGTKNTKNITILSSRASCPAKPLLGRRRKSRDLKLIDSDEIPPLLIVGRNDKYIRVY